MSGQSFAHSVQPVRKVKEVQFGVMSPEEIKAYSVVKIDFWETYDESGQKPKVGGLNDPRLGTTDRNFKCQTCGEDMKECPGHFGHIELARPVYHYGFMAKVKKILECICTHCGKLKADEYSDPKFAEILRRTRRDPKRRFQTVWEYVKGKMVCEPDEPKEEDEGMNGHVPEERRGHGGCGHIQPAIRREGLRFFAVWKKSKDEEDEAVPLKNQTDKKLLPASEVHMILKKISDEDINNLGLSAEYARPDWMVLTVLPVPPQTVRPGITEGVMKAEDDLTHKLQDIIKANGNVARCLQEGAPAHVTNEFESLLQFHVATYMDNDIAGQPQAMQKTGRPLKSIRARLKGKEGRLRGNLMGKRVDYSARTVITGDPFLELDEVGVPYTIARNLTYPERVTPYNISYLQELVRNGPNEYPGARYVIRDTGERIDLRYNKRADTFLQYGWIVERHLKDGDMVLFNRQPSLHKMSMMAHRVKLLPYSTFRLNLSVTPPYNADFDGDEMNLHVPQSEETRAELSQIAWVPRQIISPQANKPVMGIVQDTLCGIRKFTVRDAFLNWEQVQNILLWVPDWDGVVPTPAIIKPQPLWSGKQIMSMCIPKGINLFKSGEAKLFNNPTDDGLFIDNGEIIYGFLTKKAVGTSDGGLVHIIFREKGPEVCKAWFSGVQKVVNFWLLHNGFSIGIGDTIADKKTMDVVTQHIKSAKDEVQDLILKAQRDELEAQPGMTIRESFEAMVNRALNRARDSAGQHAESSLKDDNAVKQMVIAGSKGSFINISQMSGCVGQQSVEGKRIPFGFRHRTLPHFTQDDFSPESRGFVENSYLRGLTPQEFFFHAMAGREGLIDTAVKTAETGYIQRRLVKALEDVMVCYDGTVRNSTNQIVQFIYGEDGLDATQVEKQRFSLVSYSDEQFERLYRVDVTMPGMGFKPGTLQAGIDDSSLDLQAVLDEEWAQLQEDRVTLREVIYAPERKDGDVWPMPVNITRLVTNATQIFHIDPRKPSDLPPAEVVQQVKQLLDRLVIMRGSDPITYEVNLNATTLFRIFVRSILASRNVLERFHLNREAFEWVLGEIETKFNQALVNPGEMCGTLAAQSIGEPATQMTLNTFHYAGVSSKNVTLGVPRLKEIINVAENIKTPSLTIYLDKEYRKDKDLAKQVQSGLAYTTLQTVTSAVEIVYDPDPSTTIIEEDRDFVEAFFAIPDEEVEGNLHKQSPWLLRFVLDRAQMLDKGFTMGLVASQVQSVFGQDLFVMHSEDNAEQLVLRCRIVTEESEKDVGDDDEDNFLKSIEAEMFKNVVLGGLQGIAKVFMVQQDKDVISSEGQWEKDKEWVLETDGSNFREILTVDHVDATRTYSNNCVEVFRVLGIEAARAAIMRELRNTIEFDGSYVNYRHLSLLCDIMTNRGRLMAITRHGINRADTGALMRCSFEETVEILLEAAAIGEADDCRGVAENVLLGQIAPMGTGAFDVAIDMDMLKDVIVDHRLPIQAMMAMNAAEGGSKTPFGGGMTPYDSASPLGADGMRIQETAAFSPLVQSTGDEGGAYGDIAGGWGTTPLGRTPIGGPTSPGYSPASPVLNLTSPMGAGATSPWYGGPTSPGYSPASPALNLTSPGHAAASPRWSPASPAFSPSSPRMSPTSPTYSPASPSFSPTSPAYSPSSPQFSPTSPGADKAAGGRAQWSPASPQWSPASPRFSPTSPAAYSPSSPQYSPTSPTYSPTSPTYSPTSPTYSPTSPTYSPTSPTYSPTSPAYSPTSPRPPTGQTGHPQTSQQSSPKPSWGAGSPSWKR